MSKFNFKDTLGKAMLLAGLFSLPAGSLLGQDKKIDLEARKRSVAVLEKHIEERIERREHLAADLKGLNQRLGGQIDKFVAKLSGLKDSPESKHRIGQLKMRSMKGLAKIIRRYDSRRNDVVREIREGRSSIPKETLERDAEIFDENITKRVSQIIELSRSFTPESDPEKYETVKGGDFYSPGLGWSDDVQRISDDWRQSRRDKSSDSKQYREIVAALEKSITRHTSLKAGLEERLQAKNLSAADRKLMDSELKRHIQILASREEQLAEMNEYKDPNTATASREEADDIELALNDSAEDLRRDFDQIFYKYSELNRERSKIGELTKNLEARKKWLSENGG